jgi:hypothetical protein
MSLLQRFSSERSEVGETLIEVLLASALMALVVVTMIGGIATMLIGSKTHRDQTTGNTVLVAAMEQLKSPITTPPACGYASLPAGVTINPIEFEVNNVAGTGVDFSASAPCPLTTSPPATPLTLQRITLRYTASGETLSFVKGKY